MKEWKGSLGPGLGPWMVPFILAKGCMNISLIEGGVGAMTIADRSLSLGV